MVTLQAPDIEFTLTLAGRIACARIKAVQCSVCVTVARKTDIRVSHILLRVLVEALHAEVTLPSLSVVLAAITNPSSSVARSLAGEFRGGTTPF